AQSRPRIHPPSPNHRRVAPSAVSPASTFPPTPLRLPSCHAGRRLRISTTRARSSENKKPQAYCCMSRSLLAARIKRGGVDLSAFHATQGRRIVTLVVRQRVGKCSRLLERPLTFSSTGLIRPIKPAKIKKVAWTSRHSTPPREGGSLLKTYDMWNQRFIIGPTNSGHPRAIVTTKLSPPMLIRPT